MQKVLGITTILALVLPSLLLTAYAAQNFANVIGQNESTIRVLPADAPIINCEFDGVLLHDLLVRNMQGEMINETVTGSQVILEATVTNYCNSSDNQVSITLFEVRGPNGITVYLAWLNDAISSNQEKVFGSSWFANVEPGNYTVRAFHISNLNSTVILHDVKTYELRVLQ